MLQMRKVKTESFPDRKSKTEIQSQVCPNSKVYIFFPSRIVLVSNAGALLDFWWNGAEHFLAGDRPLLLGGLPPVT